MEYRRGLAMSRLSVCQSVCLSNASFVTKQKVLPRFLDHMKECLSGLGGLLAALLFAVVGRSEDDDCVGVEEIDSLQLELEILLASAAKRMRYIHNELTLLDEWIEKGTVTPSTTGKDKAIAAAAASAAAASQQVVIRLTVKLLYNSSKYVGILVKFCIGY